MVALGTSLSIHEMLHRTDVSFCLDFHDNPRSNLEAVKTLLAKDAAPESLGLDGSGLFVYFRIALHPRLQATGLLSP